MNATGTKPSATPNEHGYLQFRLGQFTFTRDAQFARVEWPAKNQRVSHSIPADAFLRALMRDVAWDFFYGCVCFDDVFGTRNLYSKVEFYAGRGHASYEREGLDYTECFDAAAAMQTCKAMLHDWTNAGYDPFAAPIETGSTWIGNKAGSNAVAVSRVRANCKRMVGLPGDVPLRSDRNGQLVNRAFLDVSQDEPMVVAEPGFENEVHAFNLFAYLSRSDVTWNPTATSACKDSLFCPTTEEDLMPVKHANDRIEWFLQLSDSIEWYIEDPHTGLPRAKILMRPGDIAAMPADVRHRGFASKRAMLLVWENSDPDLPKLHESGELPPSPAVEFTPSSGSI